MALCLSYTGWARFGEELPKKRHDLLFVLSNGVRYLVFEGILSVLNGHSKVLREE